MHHPKKLALAGALAMLAAVPATASADSLVYVKGGSPTGNVYIARPDGSSATQLTGDGQGAWPSAADDGTVVYGNESDGRLYVLTPGGSLDHSMTTAGSYEFPKAQHVRVSPDGSKIAYDYLLNGSEYTTLWTPTSSTNINTPSQTLGQEAYTTPSWYGGDNLMLTHLGSTFSGEEQFTYYHAGDPDNSERNWFSDPSPPFEPTGWDGAVSRDGTHVAVMENDAANYTDATPRNVVIRVFAASGTAPAPAAFQCQLTLPADGSYYRGSPTFSPDGSQIAWSEADGVHEASAGCAGDHLAIPGGSQPYWAAANPPAPASTGGASKARATFTFKPKKPKAKRKTTFRGKLSGASARKFAWSFGDGKKGKGARAAHTYRKAGRYKVKLVVTMAGGGRATAHRTVKVGR